MDPITLLIFIIVGGVFIGGGVHFIPVGGAPAAMATATGVGTGTAMLAAGAGLTGLITAASMSGQPWYLIALAGAIGAMMMMGITMFVANIIYVYGVGVVPSSAKTEVDPITGRNQEKYVTPGTEGHGVPTVCFVSGIIGGLLGGAGGGLVYYAIEESFKGTITAAVNGVPAASIIAGLAAIIAVGVFFVNSVVASYNIGGTIEGFHDPKFKRIGRGILACGIASAVLGVFIVILSTGVVA
ncbi:tetrahydromethanopterin S-methyltransferase subunit D [Methanobrevibacter filiformis]|uniref:Tetrahydromethanopterin S-methyltransferase subunit D n=1 Tax=Methanobrevibacter filiformis TaxID=55758 RepID=A0A166A6W3_9EURY|nr:tetrahydromethanopterin S-methyltransferase subunit D [Methanobrevibacter filiformis]KZX11646.1 tetrahydromethanopterin S-methyltransferase subunit D [Methanobrevibacter filiformis]